MFLVLGAVALSVIIVTLAMTRRALTSDLRIAEWAKVAPGDFDGK